MSADTVFVKMHTGDPGVGGTANAAVNATRKLLSVADELGYVPSTDSIRLVQDTVVAYTGGEVTATESYAWLSYWTAVTGGTWLGNEDIPNQAATIAVALNIAVGVITVTPLAVLDYLLRTELAGSRISDRRHRNWHGSHRATLVKLQRVHFAKQNPQTI